jgi:cytochrome c oxidase assembly protein subunit 15
MRYSKTGINSAKFAVALLGVISAQAMLGLTQTWLGLPVLLVGIHMLGASVLASMITYQALLNKAWSGLK